MYSPIEQQGERLQTKERKVFFCDIPGCSKTFYQKTHLDIHRRAHTGDKPYVSALISILHFVLYLTVQTCKLPGCGHRFSQLGNLKVSLGFITTGKQTPDLY